ncbi:hypothetical protein JCM6882_001636 [Rhodosporidiobolus microsporus]
MSSNQNEQNQEEQQFSILPHPAKDNNPTQETTPGLGSAPTLDGNAGVFGARGDKPHIVSEDLLKGLEEPKSREELQALQAKLNE